MRFKQQTTAKLPEINLIPMLNVMMGILAFFVMITMTLTAQQSVDIQLPNPDSADPSQNAPDPVIVELNPQGQTVINDQTLSQAQLTQQIQLYLSQNPQGFVILKADRQLPYELVVQQLQEMRQIGGDRVSLAIE